ncbi:DUF2490 domain-containing protein [Pedobacter ginsengisoli]|uniref:DUF2490 domain-containing protein n=1 Tax=Pedobacter ginsengisoli TaxID=363852 RepID=UPI00255150BB|nr:DUF2490 domain-containing protein [Pedobacter ginsengisoli]
MRIYLFLLVILCICRVSGKAQTTKQNTGWLFLMNSTRISKDWGVHFDAQFRSQDEWDGLRHVLIRPGITYFINSNNDLTLGYLFTQTNTELTGVSDNTLTEHRIWQQYIHKHKVSIASVSHRLRLEQRFIERYGNDYIFAQRLRYFVRFLVPLQKPAQSFDKGLFAALQDEVFFNVQNKNNLNGSLFDQNRAYFAIGYRFSKKIDIEAGYMNQSLKGPTNNTSNNIGQLAVYTRF